MRGSMFARREIVPGAVSQATPAARLVFLRKVYALFLLGLGIAGLGGWVGTQTGIGYTSPGLLLLWILKARAPPSSKSSKTLFRSR